MGDEERKEVLAGVGAANSDVETNKAFDEYDEKVTLSYEGKSLSAKRETKEEPRKLAKGEEVVETIEPPLAYYLFLVLAFFMGAATMLVVGKIISAA